MSEEATNGPVDNSHRDAGIAARESQQVSTANAEAKPAKPEQDAPAKTAPKVEAEAMEAAGEEVQNDSGESATPGDDEQAKPKNKGVGKRIDELTKARYDAERERDYWREQAMRQQGTEPDKQPATTERQASSDDDEPTLESCDFDQAEFVRRWYSWRRQQDEKVAEQESRRRAFEEREAAFRAEHPDYDAVIRDPSLPFSQAVAEVISLADNPPAVIYHLAQNREELAAIAQMNSAQMGRAIGRIEAKLSTPPTPAVETVRQPEPKTVTKAPPPVTTLSGAPAVKKAPDEMSMAEYEAHRRAERAAKGLAP